MMESSVLCAGVLLYAEYTFQVIEHDRILATE